jgi:hypothetical protein
MRELYYIYLTRMSPQNRVFFSSRKRGLFDQFGYFAVHENGGV